MKITAYLHYKKYSWEDKGKFELWPCMLTENPNNMFIKIIEVDALDTDIPTDKELINWKVTNLNKQKQVILADTHIKVKKIEEQIQQLLSLPNLTEELI